MPESIQMKVGPSSEDAECKVSRKISQAQRKSSTWRFRHQFFSALFYSYDVVVNPERQFLTIESGNSCHFVFVKVAHQLQVVDFVKPC
jgi:hypothetical protein